MSVQEIAEQVAVLTPAQQQRVVQLLAELTLEVVGTDDDDDEMAPLRIGDPSISVTELFGIWADRTDIGDGAEWVHNLRRGPVWNRLKR